MIRNKVAQIRIEQGLTQEKLAKKAEMSRVALSAIENGTVPNGDTMLKISKALERKVEELFYEENVKHK